MMESFIYATFFCIVVLTFFLVQRLYYHTLTGLPGPRLAALTSFYEFYYNALLGGKFVFKLADLHARYGPIVRISPREVHINDPAYFDQLYNVTGRLDKDGWYYAFIASQDAGFGTPDADLHRARRKAMSRFFSSSAITRLEASARTDVEKLCQRLDEMRKNDKPVNLSNAFRCLAADSVTRYCLPKPFDLLSTTDFAEDYNRQARTLSWIGIWHRHIPVVLPIFMAMPRWFVKMTSSQGGLLCFDFQMDLARQATDVVNAKKRSDKTVLDGIVNSDLTEDEKNVDRVTQEARVLVGAGTETTGAVLDTIVFNILSNPGMEARLTSELEDASQSNSKGRLDSIETLRQLPYLTAVIKEGLRLTNSVSGRMPRINTKHAHVYGTHTLPPGTVMSMSLVSLHMNADAFPNPTCFRPERWLVEPDRLQELEKSFAPFGRGARSCVGKELAMMNLFLMTANFFQKFDAELFETSYRDLEMEHDLFAPFPHKDSRGLRVKVR